ncbi:MAG: citrate lyase acyl carrier protein [Asgard group archaeon]|nr:citrate lyase acyl carrier protein [Asgard group archaeon]
MKVKKTAQAGSLESCDILITIEPAKSKSGIKLILESPAKKQFGEKIEAEIMEMVNKHQLSDAVINAIDRGALGYCIKARTETAIIRACGDD